MSSKSIRTSKFSLGIATAAIVATLGLSACSQAEEAINSGGDTKCSDYIAQDNDKQRVTVTKYLKERDNGTEPNANQVDMAMTAIDLLCRAQNNASVPIKDADLAGIIPTQ